MTPENLEWLHETLKRLGKIMADEWAKNEALAIILKENGVCNCNWIVQNPGPGRFELPMDELRRRSAGGGWLR